MTDAFEWRSLLQLEPEKIQATRQLMHHAIQNVAAVGRKFSPQTDNDSYGTLIWVPGLSRLAGEWVTGNITFRSSLSIEDFKVLLVDKKVSTLASFELEGRTYRQLMLWLEEQIGKLGLEAANLTMNLPYKLPDHPILSGEPFRLEFGRAAVELSKYYHNAYVILRQIKQEYESDGEIVIWPRRFDMAMSITLKDTGDPETDTVITFGMSPGDESFPNPYFYISTKPFVDTALCSKLPDNALWVSEEWTGAVLLSKQLFEGDQELKVKTFFKESADQLIKLLTQ